MELQIDESRPAILCNGVGNLAIDNAVVGILTGGAQLPPVTQLGSVELLRQSITHCRFRCGLDAHPSVDARDHLWILRVVELAKTEQLGIKMNSAHSANR
jgi:hypothetical protein